MKLLFLVLWPLLFGATLVVTNPVPPYTLLGAFHRLKRGMPLENLNALGVAFGGDYFKTITIAAVKAWEEDPLLSGNQDDRRAEMLECLSSAGETQDFWKMLKRYNELAKEAEAQRVADAVALGARPELVLRGPVGEADDEVTLGPEVDNMVHIVKYDVALQHLLILLTTHATTYEARPRMKPEAMHGLTRLIQQHPRARHVTIHWPREAKGEGLSSIGVIPEHIKTLTIEGMVKAFPEPIPPVPAMPSALHNAIPEWLSALNLKIQHLNRLTFRSPLPVASPSDVINFVDWVGPELQLHVQHE